MKKKILFILSLIFWLKLNAQKGDFFYRNYSPAQAGNAAEQNWGITQDKQGRLFVANLNGVYVYDGKNWEEIQLNNNANCTSIERDSSYNIYAGGLNEFGVIKRKDKGIFQYISISNQLKNSELDFGNIWKIICVGTQVYFCSNTKIFLYEENKLTAIQSPEGDFHSFNIVGDQILTRVVGKGLFFVSHAKLIAFNDTAFKDTRVYGVVEIEKDKHILFTREKGVYILRYNPLFPKVYSLNKIETGLGNWLLHEEIYCALKIESGKILLGSKKDGFKIIDKNFETLNYMNEKTGLLDDGVYNIYKDKANNIWLALANGICYIETNTPITRWTGVNGIKGSVEAALKFKDNFFIATIKNLQKLNTSSRKFETTEIDFPCYNLVANNNSLFIGTDKGVYQYNNEKYIKVNDANGGAVYNMTFVQKENVLFLGTDFELLKGHFEKNRIIIDHAFSEAANIRTSAVNKNGELLFGSATNGIFYLHNANDTNLVAIDTTNGLPSMFENKVFLYNDEFVACTDSGFYKIDAHSKIKIYRDKKFIDEPRIKFVECATQVSDEIWFMHKYDDEKKKPISVLNTYSPSSKLINSKQLHRLRDLTVKEFYIYNDIVYIAANTGLYAYEYKQKENKASFSTIISKIYNHKIEDTLFQNIDVDIVGTMKEIVVNYSDNEISFEAAASDYIDKDKILFCWYLEGSDEKKYNNYTDIANIHYSNLHEGEYVLHLKSENILGIEGNELSVKIKVLPPWYRTWWAYSLYVVFFILLIWALVFFYTKRLRRKNIQLENIIQERTKTVTHQKAEIEEKNREITDSINYAKRIQQSILPDINEIKEVWKNTMIFYQPKDIVSGDFYWYSKINNEEFLIACADCTGHGVPGGFMCMICSDKLHAAATVTKQVDEILFHTNNGVKKALKQGTMEGGSKDGMEIGLLKVNTISKEIQFTSANRPLYIIKKGQNFVEEIKPTKASIASFTEFDFKYDIHNLKLNAGDTLYLTSDGYPDQFGGPEGRKFMTKNFKELLLSIVHLSIEEQNNFLKEKINKWMVGYDQVDDLLVIGIKL